MVYVIALGDNIIYSSQNPIETNLLPDVNAPTATAPLTKAIPDHKRHRGHCIILYLPAILDPIQLWNQSLITLGRKDNYLNLYPTVDLSDHHAALLGVSRLHAEITYENSNYYVRDLNSKNGTWVNKNRLIADEKIQLVNQDTLRLAHFMIQVSAYQN